MSERRAPSWIFGITSIPYGACAAFASTLMPYFLRNANVKVEKIGWFVTASLLPATFNFLYAPIVDLGPRRRTWLVLMACASALCLPVAMSLPLAENFNLVLAITVVAQAMSGLISSANGGLMATTLDDHERGRAGGWYNAGNLGGGALGAGLILAMATGVPGYLAPCGKTAIGVALCATMMLPALAAFWIPEPVRPKVAPAEHMRAMLREVWKTAKSRPGWSGMLLCASPVGTAALLNYFSGLAMDYKATAGMVTFVNGALNGLITAVGAVAGGWICDHMDRRRAYLLSGLLTAAVGMAMALGPLTPTTYAVGVCVYFLVAGFCYAAFSAVVLEAVGKAGASASAQYALFVAAGNFAIMYVGWVDTRFHESRGVAGLLKVDAGLNLAGVVALGLLFALVFKKKPEQAAAAA